MELIDYCEFLVKSIVKKPELVKVKTFGGDEDATILEIIVSKDDIGRVIGKQGKMASSLRTMILAYAYLHNIRNLKIIIDSF